MAQATWDFVDSGPSTGQENMRVDEAFARELEAGKRHPTVRLFRWEPWAISLGHNQSWDAVDRDACVRDGIDVVRRPTGGRAILHAEELTYSVVMYAGRKSVLQAYNEISRALLRGLTLLGVDAELQRMQPDFPERYRHVSSVPCFTSSARYEIEWRGRKLVGSAQRRFSDGEHDVVLQHGSILCGPAHRRLSAYLALRDADERRLIARELGEKTTDLHEILGRDPDMTVLAACIRQGFEREWGITFDRVFRPAVKSDRTRIP